MFARQFETRFEIFGSQLLTKVESELTVVKTQLDNLQAKEMDLEEHNMVMTDAQRNTSHAVQTLEQKLVDLSMDVSDRLGKLEAFSRRDNLKFFNIPQSRNENHDTCTATLLEFLQNTIPNKQWSRDDIMRAHRLGNSNQNSNGYTRPQPIIAKFAMWSNKMDIQTKGREQLKRKSVRVAGDLTTRQQKVIKGYRDKGQRA